jgi:hypothetical protein
MPPDTGGYVLQIRSSSYCLVQSGKNLMLDDYRLKGAKKAGSIDPAFLRSTGRTMVINRFPACLF